MSRSNRDRPVLIVLSHLRWDFVTQRPQHLLSRAVRDYDVTFVEEPLFEGDQRSTRTTQREPGIRLVQPLLPPGCGHAEALAHQRHIVEELAREAGTRRMILWFYTPMAIDFADGIGAELIVFDKMDELSAFKFADPRLVANEARLLEIADVVFTGGASMHAASADRHSNIHCFPSSIDTAHFGAARRPGSEPADQAGVQRPRLGFFGVIDERVDTDLIRAVAAARPDWQFIMLGPTAKIEPADLPHAANLHWLGGKPYAELPAYLSGWDIGWMPFAMNESTRFISPTKTPEFLAGGLPVVSTAIADVVEPYGRLGLVEIAGDVAATVAAVERLLVGRHDEAAEAARLAAVDAHLAQGSWDRTWSAMQALIEAAQTAATPQLKETARV